MRLKHSLIAGIICVATGSFAFAQSVPPPPPPVPSPSPQSAVHVTTRIVQVSVTVHDENGRPVTGLTKDDFVLMDQGHPQQIASFSEQKNLVTTTRAAAPNVFTNRFSAGDSQPPLTMITSWTFTTQATGTRNSVHRRWAGRRFALLIQCSPRQDNLPARCIHKIGRCVGNEKVSNLTNRFW